MYQIYLGASLYEFVTETRKRLNRKRDDDVTYREAVLHLMDDDAEEKVRERDQKRENPGF